MKKPWLTQRNLTDNPVWRPEVRAKISRAMKGNKNCLGRKMSAETRQKIAIANTGKKQSEATRQKKREIALRLGSKPPQLQHTWTGNKHPRWKGGLTPERQKDFRSPEYLAFVKSVLERDNYTCQRCGAKNGTGYHVALQVHHKIPYAERPDLRYDIDNGVTLCFDCHNLTKSKRPKTVDFVPKKERICAACHKPFAIFNPRKYCPACRAKYCCPVCGSTNCSHKERKLYRSQLPQFT